MTLILFDRRGYTTRYKYDSQGNVTQKTDPDGNITAWTFDENGNKLTETDPLDHTTAYTYDSRDNLLSETDPLGNTTSYTYNSRNQVLTVSDPKGYTTQYGYDDKGNYLFEDFGTGKTAKRHHTKLGFLWFLFPRLEPPADDRKTVRAALAAALKLSKGKAYSSSTCGLRAYDNWIKGVKDGKADEGAGGEGGANCIEAHRCAPRSARTPIPAGLQGCR